MFLAPQDWLTTIESEYLRDYLPRGGSAVKFAVVQSAAMAGDVRDRLGRAAVEAGCQFAFVDAAGTRVHMVDQLFFAVARQLDWDALAREYVRRQLERNGIPVPSDPDSFDFQHIAELRGRSEIFLRQDVRDLLIAGIHQDFAMTKDFRFAMLRLCQAALEPRGTRPPEVESVLGWLRGELRVISALKPVFIYQRIGRHSARDMFVSLAHWLRLCGRHGFVLALDVSRYVVDRRANDGSLFHSPMAAMDTWEVLRQFIDATDDLEGTVIAVISTPEFLEHPRRGLDRYDPLKMRIWDEVHDRRRVNPLAALVRLAECATAAGRG